VLDQRGRLLTAALGFAGLPRPSYDRALWALRNGLDSWAGIGHVAVGMHRHGDDLQLTRYDERGWRATFYTTGMEHSPTSATGRVTWHALRHTFASRLVAAGVDLRAVQELGGWKTLNLDKTWTWRKWLPRREGLRTRQISETTDAEGWPSPVEGVRLEIG
jgi:integrase